MAFVLVTYGSACDNQAHVMFRNQCTDMRVLTIALLSLTLDVVIPEVQTPAYSEFNRQLFSGCNFVAYDRVLLKRLTLLSKYIFTGRVYGVSAVDNNTRVYKVNIRRVLKGDLHDIGVAVKFGTAKSLRFSDATVLVEGSQSVKCSLLRVRTYAIFLTKKKHDGGVPQLKLVVEPVLLTLRNIEIIEAAIKGKNSFDLFYCNLIVNIYFRTTLHFKEKDGFSLILTTYLILPVHRVYDIACEGILIGVRKINK